MSAARLGASTTSSAPLLWWPCWPDHHKQCRPFRNEGKYFPTAVPSTAERPWRAGTIRRMSARHRYPSSETRGQSWTGGQTGCQLLSLITDQLRSRLFRAGPAATDFDQLDDFLADPCMALLSPPLLSTSGRRPR
jgi:hypothetical protein